MAEIKFEFSPEDKGFSAFIDKIKKQFADLNKVQSSPMDNKGATEGINALKQQINHIKSKIASQKEYLNLLDIESEKLRGTKGKELSANRVGNQAALLGNNIETNQTKADSLDRKLSELVDAMRHPEESKEDKKSKSSAGSIFNSILAANLVRDLGGIVKSVPSAQNASQFIKPITSLIGTAMGGALGGLVGLIPGLGGAGALGATLGKEVGEFVGTSAERTFTNRDQLASANLSLQALTGQNQGVDNQSSAAGSMNSGYAVGRNNKDLSGLGLDFIKSAQMLAEIAKSQGSSKNLGGTLAEVAGLKSALGIENSQSYGLLSLKKENSKSGDLVNTIGGLLKQGSSSTFAGGDRTLLPQVIQRFTDIQKEALEGQTTIGEKTVSNILFGFNKMGGAFSAADPRSAGFISGAQSSTANATGNSQALLLSELQRLNPKLSPTQLIEEQQKGMEGSKLVRTSMVNLMKRFGGSTEDGQARFAASQYFGGKIYAGRQFARHSGAFGNIENGGNLHGDLTTDGLMQTGASQTSYLSKSGANISNSFTKGIAEGIGEVKKEIIDLFKVMLSAAKDEALSMVNPAPKNKAIISNAIKNSSGNYYSAMGGSAFSH